MDVRLSSIGHAALPHDMLTLGLFSADRGCQGSGGALVGRQSEGDGASHDRASLQSARFNKSKAPGRLA